MKLDRNEVKAGIRAKVMALAQALGMDAGDVTDDAILPATGLLDSNAILELVVWFETAYDFPIRQEDVNIDNLGSIDAMADFLLAHKG